MSLFCGKCVWSVNELVRAMLTWIKTMVILFTTASRLNKRKVYHGAEHIYQAAFKCTRKYRVLGKVLVVDTVVT